ncbi:MAG: DUF1844 domain-containing protein [Planctomycetota bacterium]|jgi:hypothetical protein
MTKDKDPEKTTAKNKGKKQAGREESGRPKTAQEEASQVKERREEEQKRPEAAVSEERPKEQPQQEREKRGEKKVVDEDWKGHVQKEKEQEQTTKEEIHPPIPEANFLLFVSGFATQALIALGQFENPMTKTKETNLDQACYTIDTLKMIQEKTKGNLTPEEERYLQGVLYDLRMSYVASVK